MIIGEVGATPEEFLADCRAKGFLTEADCQGRLAEVLVDGQYCLSQHVEITAGGKRCVPETEVEARIRKDRVLARELAAKNANATAGPSPLLLVGGATAIAIAAWLVLR